MHPSVENSLNAVISRGLKRLVPGKRPVMVVSHERSGTHFTMNSLAACFGYASMPWIDLDHDVFNINYHDPRILTQFPGQLVGADVHGEHVRGAASEQDLGEAPGGAADVHRHGSRRIESEMRDRVVELDPAAPDPRVVASAHLDRGIGAELLPGLAYPGVPGEHQSGHHQRLRPGAALG